MRATVANLLVRPLLFGLMVLIVLAADLMLNSSVVLALFTASAAATCLFQYAISRATHGTRPAMDVDNVAINSSDRRAWLESGFSLLFPIVFLEFLVDLTILLSDWPPCTSLRRISGNIQQMLYRA